MDTMPLDDLKMNHSVTVLEPIASSDLPSASMELRHECRHVWRKIDLRILPLVATFNLLAFMDRTNFGNARVAGLQNDLHMTDRQYTIALTMTYVPYILVELPSNLVLKAVGPNRLLPTLVTLWSVVATLQGLVKSYSGLLACRFFLGLFEGGLFPGVILYLSYFYPRDKMHTRIAILTSCSNALAGAFSGLLAYGIIHMDGIASRPGWAWIFILEGLFTFIFGIFSFLVIPRSVDQARFLSSREKIYVDAKLADNGEHGAGAEQPKSLLREVAETFKLPQFSILAVSLFLTGAGLYGLAYFTPSILASLKYEGEKLQLMTVPPYAAAFVISMAAGYISDRFQCRGVISIGFSLIAAIGFAIFLVTESRRLQYASLFFSITGIYTTFPALVTWNAVNVTPHLRRATAIAVTTAMVNCGGIFSTWLLGSISPAPRYTSATITLLSFSLAVALLCVVNLLYLRRKNLEKRHRRANNDEFETVEKKRELGDRSVYYIYHL